MKLCLILLAVLAFTALPSRGALAHPDVLGAPDPYWQSVAPAGASDATPAGRGAGLPRLLDGFVYASGGLSAVLVLSLLRSLRGSAKRPER